jgi:hypothetical protein
VGESVRRFRIYGAHPINAVGKKTSLITAAKNHIKNPAKSCKSCQKRIETHESMDVPMSHQGAKGVDNNGNDKDTCEYTG